MSEESISRQEKLAWLVGIVEGEGSIECGWTNQYTKDKKKIPSKMLYCRIKIGNTDPRMIKRVSEVYKDLSIGFSYRTTKRQGLAKKWMVEIKTQGKGNCRKLIEHMLPYMICKKDQALAMLEIIDYRESLGYHGGFRAISGSRWTGWEKVQDWTPLEEDEHLLSLVAKLRELKTPPSASETTRKANQVLGL